MAENANKKSNDDLKQLINGTLNLLGELQVQLGKIIEVREKQVETAGKNIEFSQVHGAADAIANLKKINAELPQAINGLKQASTLSQQLYAKPETTVSRKVVAGALISGEEENVEDQAGDE